MSAAGACCRNPEPGLRGISVTIRVIRDDVNSRGLHFMPAIGAFARFQLRNLSRPAVDYQFTQLVRRAMGRAVEYQVCTNYRFHLRRVFSILAILAVMAIFSPSILPLYSSWRPPAPFSNFYGYRMDIPAVSV